jgi:multiple sugar transport system substrate-binding protein
MWSRWQRFFSLMTVLSMLMVLLAACGGETPTATTAPAAATATTGTTGGTTDMTATPATGGAVMTPTTAMTGTTEMTATPAMTGTVMTPTTATGGAATTPTEAGAMGTAGAGVSVGGGPITLPGTCSNVQLAYWNGLTGPDGQFMMQLVNSFNGANPNIKVTMNAQSDYNTKLDTAAASDSLPDVAIINEDQIATQAFRHIIGPMDSVVQQMGVSQADFPAAAWTLATVAGHPYGIPLSIVPMTMYYNMDLMQKYNISAPPKTGDDFATAAAAMTKDGNNGFMITSGFPVQQIFQMLLHQYGGTEYSADGTKATWNSDAGVQALTWMVNAQKTYSKPKLPVDADLNAFKTGTVGMIWNGIWQTSNVTGEGVDFKSGATAPPQIGPNPASWAGMALLSLPVHKKGEDPCKQAASAVFIKYLLDNSVEWSKGGNIPASNAVRQSAAFQAIQPQASIAPAVEHPVFPPPIPGIADAFAPLGDAVTAVMAGTTTDIKAALDNAANRSNQILAQNVQKYGTDPATSHPPTSTPTK